MSQDPIALASSLLLQSPPGEVNDVFNDIRAIVGNDEALTQSVIRVLEEYNTEQFIGAKLDGQSHEVIISRSGQLSSDPSRFVDPRSRQSFRFDHLRLIADDLQPIPVDDEVEEVRNALDKATALYVSDHYREGICTVYALPHPTTPTASTAPSPPVGAGDEENTEAEIKASEEGVDSAVEAVEKAGQEGQGATGAAGGGKEKTKYVVHIVGNRYKTQSYWTGRWRSSYVIDPKSLSVRASILVNVHYYEQGNVQLSTNFPTNFTLSPTSSSPADLAKAFLTALQKHEGAYQTALNDAYSDLGDKAFKGLRRALPLTRQKLDWDKVMNYKLGAELRG